MDPFRLETPQAALDDLDERLARTRFAVASPGQPWGPGLPPERLRQLVGYWRDEFDWRERERTLNDVAQFTTLVDGSVLHWAHLSGRPGVPTIVLVHGWPYTFAEMLPLARTLAGDFSVVVPSLPGHAFSAARAELFTNTSVAALLHRLIREVIGVDRFFVYGEDVGAGICDWWAASEPESVLGIIAPHPAFPRGERALDMSDAEREAQAGLDEPWIGGLAYGEIQATKPDTLAAGLTDSPAGLAAWIVEKFHAWSDGDPFSDDQLLTTVMLYWLTGSIGTSFRSYSDERLSTEPDELPRIAVPAAILVQQHERSYPRSYADRTYDDVRSFRLLERGGHFTASEAPDDVASTVRALATEVLEG